MFSIFKREPTEAEAIQYCQALAKESLLDVAYSDGEPTFVIAVRVTGKAAAPYLLKFRSAMSAFIEVMEQRILGEFPSDPTEKQLTADDPPLYRGPVEIFAYRDGQTTGYARLHPVTERWTVFTLKPGTTVLKDGNYVDVSVERLDEARAILMRVGDELMEKRNGLRVGKFDLALRVVGSSELKGMFRWRYTDEGKLLIESV